ncbi:PRD domain-containing protein [Coprobacillus sp. AF36-10BH]|nr:PRD domain-containing protein [Coprobacillus sp. AF36-10BH]
MLNANQEKIIKIILSNNNLIKSKDIAIYMNLSERTVRNSIRQLNESYENFISKKKDGYHINDISFAQKLVNSHAKFDLTQKQREEYLLKILLKDNYLDYFDIAEKLYVSEHTIESDLSKLKKNIKEYHLELFKHKSNYTLIGQEEDKRKLFSNLIYDNSQGLTNDYLDTLNQDYDINAITSIVKSILLKNNLRYNAFTLNNLVVHIVVYIERLSLNNTTKLEYDEVDTLSSEYQAAIELTHWIEENFFFKIADNEIRYLTLILKSKTAKTQLDTLQKEMNTNFIDFISLTSEIIDRINEEYVLNIKDENFFSRLLLHICELNKRVELHRLAKNPFSLQMKLSYPFIYEIGVFISNILLKYGLVLNDDEITYLAFHVGSYIEENRSSKLVNIALFIPKYLNIQQINENRLKEQLNSIAHIECIDDLKVINQYDFIVSPVEIEEISIPYIKVSPFINSHDIENVKEHLKSFSKNTNSLISKYNKFCSANLFIKEHYENTPEEMIRYICSLMEKEDVVDKQFVDNVLKREALSSTAYMNNIALPHSLTQQAKKATICIVINKKSMNWNGSQVNVVILIAGSQNDRFLFRELTDALTSKMYSSTSLLTGFLECNQYEDVLKVIFE